MKHFHTDTNTTYQIGQLYDTDGKSFDINIITKWDEVNDFEQSPVLIDYYFGDLDTDATNYCIDEFNNKQDYLKIAIKTLEGKLTVDESYMEPAEIEELRNTIKYLRSMIVEF